MKMINLKTFKLELLKLDCIDKFGYVIIPITKLDIALERSAVNAEPVRYGKWIDHHRGRWIYARCSKCETVQDVETNYCPNCGAKMFGGDKDDLSA